VRRLLYLAVISLAAILVLLVPPAWAQQGATCDRFWTDGDPWWPGGEPSSPYPSQEKAQEYFDTQATPEERAILDLDHDGFACDAWGTGVDKLGIQGGENGFWGSDGHWYYY
jgi:hypothetical protein